MRAEIMIAAVLTSCMILSSHCSSGESGAPNLPSLGDISSRTPEPKVNNDATVGPHLQEEIDKAMSGLSELEKQQVDSLVRFGQNSTLTISNLKVGNTGKLALPRKPGQSASRLARFVVSKIIDDDEMLIEGGLIWIEGVPTEGIADEEKISLSDYTFVVTGTKKYQTVSGSSRTVKHLTVVNTKKVNDVAARIRTILQNREWYDSDNKFLHIAQFIEFKNGKYRIEDLQGRFADYSLNELSKQDQTWLRDEVKRQAKEKAAAKRRSR